MKDQVPQPYAATREVITDATEIVMKRTHRDLVYKSSGCYYCSRRSYGHTMHPQTDRQEFQIYNLNFLDFGQRMHKITSQL